jgi:protein phosphatase
MTLDSNEGHLSAAAYHVDAAALTDTGTGRELNEDACAALLETPSCALLVVADGVSSSEAGEVASQMAVEVVLRAFREEPGTLDAGQRLYRAVQQANIDIYDKAIAVPELRGMATTLTATVVDQGQLTVVHVGDSRLYLLRDGTLTQLTKDHTLAAEKSRYGLMGRERARTSADRCVLTRSVGRELIVSRDRSTQRLVQGDVLVSCTDGLYNVLADPEIARVASGLEPAAACRALVDAANALGTADNVTAAVLRVIGPTPEQPSGPGWGTRLRNLVGLG